MKHIVILLIFAENIRCYCTAMEVCLDFMS